MNKLWLRVDELKPRDSVTIYDEELKKNVIARVASIDHGVVKFTDGCHIKVYDDEYLVEVRRLTVVK